VKQVMANGGLVSVAMRYRLLLDLWLRGLRRSYNAGFGARAIVFVETAGAVKQVVADSGLVSIAMSYWLPLDL